MMGSGMAAHEWCRPKVLHDRIEALEKERDAALKLSHAAVARGMEVGRQMRELQDQVILLRDALTKTAIQWSTGEPYSSTYFNEALAATEPKE